MLGSRNWRINSLKLAFFFMFKYSLINYFKFKLSPKKLGDI